MQHPLLKQHADSGHGFYRAIGRYAHITQVVNKVPGAKTVATRTGKDWPGEVHIQIIPGNGTGPPGTQLTIQLSNLRQRVRWCTDQILVVQQADHLQDRKSTRLNSSHVRISYAVFCLKKKKKKKNR